MLAEPTGSSWQTFGSQPKVVGSPGGFIQPFAAGEALLVGAEVEIDSDFIAWPAGTDSSNTPVGVVVGGKQTRFACSDSSGNVGTLAANPGELVQVCMFGVAYSGSDPFSAVKRPIIAPTDPVGVSSLINSTVPGDGRTVGSLADYLANNTVFNVKDYGAVGDGTTDDSAGIQAALNAVPAGGALVLLPAGTFKVTSSLHVMKAGTIIAGVGPTSNIVSSVTGAETIISTGLDNVAVQDLQISGAHGGGIFILFCNNPRVERCWVSGATLAGGDGTQVGIKLTGVTGAEINWNRCFGNGDPTSEGGGDIRANFGTYQIVNSRITYNRCESTAVVENIALFDPRDCLVHGNYCSGAIISPITNTRLGYGIMLYETGSVALANVCDNIVSENRIRSTQGTGIYSTGCLRSVIIGNHLRDVCSLESDSALAAGGIVVEGPNSKGSLVIGNKVLTSTKDAIQVSSADNVTVTGNNVDGCAQNGISLRGVLNRANINSNTVANVAGKAIGSYSDTVQANVTIGNNTIDTLTVVGVSLGISSGASADSWNVIGNVLVSCNGRGMDLNGSNFIAHHNTEEGVPWFDGVSPDRGNADVTLTAYDKRTQRFAANLTANHVVTLPASTKVFKDAKFRVIREDTAAFSLTIKDAGGTTIATIGSGGNGWVDVEWSTGGFWRETAKGSL